jgi:integrase
VASVYLKRDTWYLRVLDADGHWICKASKAKKKTEARRLAEDWEKRFERQRLGLEQPDLPDGGGTVDELMEWWIDKFLLRSASATGESSIRKHIIGSSLGERRLVDVTPGKIDLFLSGKEQVLSPRSVNHLRGYLSRAFTMARRMERFPRQNPAADVPKRKVVKRLPDYLRPHEVPPVLAALHPQWKELFATAIYTGMRKGELFAVQKSDVDFTSGLIMVSRSHERDSPKGGRVEAIPINSELLPYLRKAIAESPSELVFPHDNGKMRPRHTKLEDVLRRAMGRAGVVTGYIHKCRRSGCGHRELAPDSTQRRCSKCTFKLFPVGQVRKIRFHHLRHTTASLLLMSGADLAAVQRIMRHQDPRTTTEFYGHLGTSYLKRQMEHLSFGAQPTDAPDVGDDAGESQSPLAAGGAEEPPLPAATSSAARFATRLLPNSPPTPHDPSDRGTDGTVLRGLTVVGARGFEPPTFRSRTERATRLRHAPLREPRLLPKIPRRVKPFRAGGGGARRGGRVEKGRRGRKGRGRRGGRACGASGGFRGGRPARRGCRSRA